LQSPVRLRGGRPDALQAGPGQREDDAGAVSGNIPRRARCPRRRIGHRLSEVLPPLHGVHPDACRTGESAIMPGYARSARAPQNALAIEMPEMNPRNVDEKFQKGVEQFNHGHFFEAHETWEEIWLPAPEPERTFLQ